MKYGSRFVGKELIISRETSLQNIESYSGKHGNLVVVLEKLFLFYSTVFFSMHTSCFFSNDLEQRSVLCLLVTCRIPEARHIRL